LSWWRITFFDPMKSELRTKGNLPSPTYNALRKDAKPLIEKLLKKYRKRLHPDSMEVALCREVYLCCAMASVRMTVGR
jgi:hypothetical protein